MLCAWCVSVLENVSCFKLNKTIYECDATALLNVFVGNGWLALVPSHLPHLRKLLLSGCFNVVDKYVEEFVAIVPELEVTK